MTDNNSISIGGVKFNKNDVAKSEVIKKDGKELNSVFLRDGTKMVYPNQSEKNESIVSMTDKTRTEKSPFGYSVTEGEFVVDYGYDPTVININKKEVKTGDVSVDFYRVNGAEITGTKKEDDYTLYGCRNTKVDVSQKDGKVDVVDIRNDDRNEHYRGFFGNREPVRTGNQHSKDGKVFISGKNEVKQNDKDITYTPTGKKGLMSKSEMHKGKGTIKE